jgi:hypothetical protein
LPSINTAQYVRKDAGGKMWEGKCGIEKFPQNATKREIYS